jgi:DNA-binding transcriptional regulator YiaG
MPVKDEQIQGLIDLRNRLDGIIADALKSRATELRHMRQAAGISLREMARHMGISAMHLSDLERGLKPWVQERRKQFEQIILGTGRKRNV